MKKRRILIASIAVVLAAAIVCTLFFVLREGSKGILYRVTGDGTTAYLLGSIHIGTSAMHPFGDTLEAAMAQADTFVFECDTVSDASLAQLAARQLLPEDTSLQSILGDELYDDVAAAYKELGLSTATLNTKQPWVAVNTLAVYSSAEEMGVQNVRKAIALGVEDAVQAYANKQGKPYAYLETVDEVADTMESFSDALTRYLLQDEIDVILKRKTTADLATVSQWPLWWRDGDADAFRDFYRMSMETEDAALYAEYEDKLLTQRNTLMAARLDALMQNGGTYFVTVGLLHLVSDFDSILTRLENMGYTIEAIP